MADAEEGQLVAGRYRLSVHLGRGGMGTVWAARDELLRRDVAVKEVAPAPGLPEAERALLVERTRREARAAASVASPSVMTVFDVVEEGDRTWIVMERLASRTLADAIAEGPLEVSEAASVGLAVLDALDAAHAAGVLHRDVKPGNVMWGPGGRVVLADFGIAQTPEDTSITQSGMVVGSPAYLAPERARGERAAGPASDLWSLGALLFAAVEGHPPFRGDGVLAVLSSVVLDDVPEAPRAGLLRPVIAGLLRKDPGERMTSREARPLLQRAVQPAPESTLVTPRVEPPAPPAPTRPAPAPLPVPAPEPADDDATAPPPPAGGAPPAASGGASPPAQGAGQRTGRRRWPVVLLVVALLAGLGAVLVSRLGADDPTASPSADASPTASASEEPTTEAPTTDEPTSTPTTSPSEPSPTPTATTPPTTGPTATSGGAVPAGFERYADDTGFSVAVPAGWEPEQEDGSVTLRDPDSSRYLLVDQTDDPAGDPLEDWQEQEPSIAQRLENYERIRLERVEFEGAQSAADLEFTWGEDSDIHVVNRNLLVSPDQAYALYWSAPDEDWPQQQALFEQISSTFQPAG